MPAANSRIVLVRHGETAWSLSGQHTGSTDLPLTPEGEAQARRSATLLRGFAFAHVFASPRARAQRTCALAGLGGAMLVEADLAEWDYGRYEGQKTADIRQTRPDWNIFRDGCPEGESPDQVGARADRLIARLRDLQGDIALFSHGHFGRVFGARWNGLTEAEAQHLFLSTASVSVLGYEHRRFEEPVILAWNQLPAAGAPG